MSLIFKNGTSGNNNYYKAYYLNWNYSKDGGSYETSKNFLSLHWEITNNKTDIIKFHVESPIFSLDPKLNLIKNKIIISILSEIINLDTDIVTNLNSIGTLSLGSRLSMSDKTKCTEVFRIAIFDMLNTNKASIEKIDSMLHDVINKVLSKYKKELDSEKLVVTE